MLVLALTALALAPASVQAGRHRPALHVPVLMYHRITCPTAKAKVPELWVCPGRFEKTLNLLKANGWSAITAAQLATHLENGTLVPANTYVITIDDGAKDGYTHVLPILQRTGAVATFGIIVGDVETHPFEMTWDQITALRDAGNEIADHSMDHDRLTTMGDERLAVEIDQSAQRIADRLGARPTTFVYPGGYWNEHVAERIKAAGFAIAFNSNFGATEKNWRRYHTPRLYITGGETPETVLGLIQPYA